MGSQVILEVLLASDDRLALCPGFVGGSLDMCECDWRVGRKPDSGRKRELRQTCQCLAWQHGNRKWRNLRSAFQLPLYLLCTLVVRRAVRLLLCPSPAWLLFMSPLLNLQHGLCPFTAPVPVARRFSWPIKKTPFDRLVAILLRITLLSSATKPLASS